MRAIASDQRSGSDRRYAQSHPGRLGELPKRHTHRAAEKQWVHLRLSPQMRAAIARAASRPHVPREAHTDRVPCETARQVRSLFKPSLPASERLGFRLRFSLHSGNPPECPEFRPISKNSWTSSGVCVSFIRDRVCAVCPIPLIAVRRQAGFRLPFPGRHVPIPSQVCRRSPDPRDTEITSHCSSIF